MKYCLLTICLLGGAGAVPAAPIAPARYIDAQGVEVIHNRGAEPAPPAAVVGAGQVTTPAEIAPPRKPVASVANDARMKISADAQRERDRDRVAILKEELANEVRALEATFQRAKQASADKLSAADSRRVTEEMYAHQQNILSLHSELRRAGQ